VFSTLAISPELATLFEKNLAIYIIMPGALFSLYKMQSLSGCFSRQCDDSCDTYKSNQAAKKIFHTVRRFSKGFCKKRLLAQKQNYFCKAAIFFVLYCISLENCLQSKDLFFQGIKAPFCLFLVQNCGNAFFS